jgi:hypothetical protein
MSAPVTDGYFRGLYDKARIEYGSGETAPNPKCTERVETHDSDQQLNTIRLTL